MSKKKKKPIVISTPRGQVQRLKDRLQKQSQAIFPQEYLRKENIKKAIREKYERRNEARGTPLLCGVYGLLDPRTKLIIYIGGSKDIHERFFQHIEAIKLGVHEDKMMQWYSMSQVLPELSILEECKQEILPERETSWIHVGLEEEWSLLNTLSFSTCHKDEDYEKMRILCKKLLSKILGR